MHLKNRINFIKDFLNQLIVRVDESYFGDYIMTDVAKREHFLFFLKSLIKDLKQASVNLKFSKSLFNFIYEDFKQNFYLVEKGDKTILHFKIKLALFFKLKNSNLEGRGVKYYDLFEKHLGDLVY